LVTASETEGCSVTVRGVGFEPTNPCGIAASEKRRFAKGGSINLALFKKWLYQTYRPFTAKMRFFYGEKYAHCLVTRNLDELRLMSDGKREHVLKALSSLSKFLGIHEDLLKLVKNYGLKWSSRSNDDIIISRLLRNVDANGIFEWIKETRTRIPELRELLEFMVITGLRLIEAIESYNLIIRLSKEGELASYYNAEKEILEHFRFKETFIRNSKKVFISFVPSELVNRIAEREPLHYDKVQRVAEYRMKKLRFGDIRELHGSILTKYLRQPEIDFLHGRVSANVFMINYFNVNLIDDLKKRTFESINEMLKTIS
jgi:hypothetical protein